MFVIFCAADDVRTLARRVTRGTRIDEQTSCSGKEEEDLTLSLTLTDTDTERERESLSVAISVSRSLTHSLPRARVSTGECEGK